MSRTIIVSDLHIDTWTSYRIKGADNREMTMKDYFFEFIDWCVERGVTEFVINGDLFNCPADKRWNVLLSNSSIGSKVLKRLAELARELKVTYVVGNHDIALNGLSYVGINNLTQLPNVQLCYPGYLIDTYAAGAKDTVTGKLEKTVIMVEHGHFADPVIQLYLNDLARRIYYSTPADSFDWAQSKQPAHMEAAHLLTSAALPPNQIDFSRNETAYQAARAEQDAEIPDVKKPQLSGWHASWWNGATKELRKRWWWEQGLDRMEEYAAHRAKRKQSKITRIYLVQGHTHLDDARDPVKRAGVFCNYLNAGTWHGSYNRAGYVEIDESGRCWLQDWINESKQIKEKSPIPRR